MANWGLSGRKGRDAATPAGNGRSAGDHLSGRRVKAPARVGISTALTIIIGTWCCGTKRSGKLVGAYRAGNTAKILSERDRWPLHQHVVSLRCASFSRSSDPAMELGRSFVRPEYQRLYSPLLLLWKGISRLLAISYARSRTVWRGQHQQRLQQCIAGNDLSLFRIAVQEDKLTCWSNLDGLFVRLDCAPGTAAPCAMRCVIWELSGPIADVEKDGKGLPILRQYAKSAAKCWDSTWIDNFPTCWMGYSRRPSEN